MGAAYWFQSFIVMGEFGFFLGLLWVVVWYVCGVVDGD
jgi:hypothetical protein